MRIEPLDTAPENAQVILWFQLPDGLLWARETWWTSNMGGYWVDIQKPDMNRCIGWTERPDVTG